MTVRISRPCYDKYWRCPGWAGGGGRFARVKRCESGSLGPVIDYGSRWWTWKIHQCPTCGVYVLPYHFQAIDPTAWPYALRRLGWRIRDWWEWRHRERVAKRRW